MDVFLQLWCHVYIIFCLHRAAVRRTHVSVSLFVQVFRGSLLYSLLLFCSNKSQCKALVKALLPEAPCELSWCSDWGMVQKPATSTDWALTTDALSFSQSMGETRRGRGRRKRREEKGDEGVGVEDCFFFFFFLSSLLYFIYLFIF